jgi:hypothetical protein
VIYRLGGDNNIFLKKKKKEKIFCFFNKIFSTPNLIVNFFGRQCTTTIHTHLLYRGAKKNNIRANYLAITSYALEMPMMGFEPMHTNIADLKSDALDHSATLALD